MVDGSTKRRVIPKLRGDNRDDLGFLDIMDHDTLDRTQ